MVLVKGNSMETLPTLPHYSPSKSLTLASSPSLPSLDSCTSLPVAEEAIRKADVIITKWDVNSSSYTKLISLFQHSRREAKDFVKSVHDLRRAMHFLVSNHHLATGQLVLAQTLMQVAMRRLEKELHDVLSSNRDKLDSKSLSMRSLSSKVGSCEDGKEEELIKEEEEEAEEEDSGGDDASRYRLSKVRASVARAELASELTVSDLNSIADCMISAGYGKECAKIYKFMRKSVVDEGIHQLGIQRCLKLSQIQKMSIESRDHSVKAWLSSSKAAVRMLFRVERSLCDHVFASSNTIRESCFYEITKDSAISLFKFPELVAKSKGPITRIYRLIELYEALSELWPEIDYMFDFKSTAVVKLQALSSLVRLGNSVQAILSDYDASIQKDSSRTPALGGGIHPLTESVMSFICSLTEYSATLSDILADHAHLEENLELPESYFGSPSSGGDPTSPISVRVARLILVLLCKLDLKADQLYNDVSLSYLFLANNLNFIVQKVSTTNLKYLLGEEWIARKEMKVRQYASKYETMAWTRVLSCLVPEVIDNRSPTVEEAKGCFRKFNSAFEETCRRQAAWVVPDGNLRDEIKVSVAKKVVGSYRVFLEGYLALAKGEEDKGFTEEFAMLGPDDLGKYLSDLFHGVAVSGSSSRSSSSSPSNPQPRWCLPSSIRVY